jgi:TPR repeat protein
LERRRKREVAIGCLGEMYQKEEGVPIKEKIAVHYYEEGVQFKDEESAVMLALMMKNKREGVK